MDLLVAAPTQAVAAARNATKTIPIVMVAAIDPVALGWVANLAYPSENLTGISFGVGVETLAKELELAEEDISTRAAGRSSIKYPGLSLAQIRKETMQTTADSFGVQLLSL